MAVFPCTRIQRDPNSGNSRTFGGVSGSPQLIVRSTAGDGIHLHGVASAEGAKYKFVGRFADQYAPSWRKVQIRFSMSERIFLVQELHKGHPQIRAADWRSPLARLLLKTDKYADGEARMRVSITPSSGAANEYEPLFQWHGLRDDFKLCMRTYQVPIITEFATLGIACLLTKHELNSEITEVTRRGERADYWIGDRELLLEVSGQQSGNLETLQMAKADQLLKNPFKKNGYVCVADYSQRKVNYCFYRYGNE